jgi:hypothetical protein
MLTRVFVTSHTRLEVVVLRVVMVEAAVEAVMVVAAVAAEVVDTARTKLQVMPHDFCVLFPDIFVFSSFC